VDSSFFTKYEDYLDNIENPGDQVKDFFEPGVPAELVRASRKTSTSTTRFVFINYFLNLTDTGSSMAKCHKVNQYLNKF
jgi:hypothetical protein